MARSRLAVEVQIESPSWRKAWPTLSADVRRLLTQTMARPELAKAAAGQIVVVFADDAKLKELNARFRGKDQPTNVLSFPDQQQPFGGIALAFETVKREALEQKKDFLNHTKHMILHGFLHLLDYDHETPRGARLMEGLEIAILSDMGVPNPYLIETTRA